MDGTAPADNLHLLQKLHLKLGGGISRPSSLFFSVGVGDFSVWEFSGNPVYFCSYDYFAANDPTSIHVIVFSLEEPYEIQLNQVVFWLSFLKSLVPVEEPIGKRRHPRASEQPSLALLPARLSSDRWWLTAELPAPLLPAGRSALWRFPCVHFVLQGVVS